MGILSAMAKQEMSLKAEDRNGKVYITLSGVIQNYKGVKSEFETTLNALKEKGLTRVIVNVNTPGGSLFEAFEISNLIKETFSDGYETQCGAMVASAGTVFIVEANKVYAYTNTMIMFHKPMMQISGNEDQLKNGIQFLEKTTKNLRQAYAKLMGVSEDKVDEMWASDFWMTSSEALELKFVNVVNESKGRVLANLNVLAKACGFKIPEPIYSELDESSPDNSNNSNPHKVMESLPLIIGALQTAKVDINDDAKEAEVVAAVQKLTNALSEAKAENKRLKSEAESAFNTQCETLVNDAIEAGKIKKTQKAEYVDFAKAKFDSCKAVLDGIKPHKPANERIDNQTKEEAKEREGWKYEDYHKKAPEALAEIKENDPDRYNELLAEFKKKNKRD